MRGSGPKVSAGMNLGVFFVELVPLLCRVNGKPTGKPVAFFWGRGPLNQDIPI